MTKVTLDKALDAIAAQFFDGVNRTENGKQTVVNRYSWAQRDILQAIAWKANSALDRPNGPDERMTKLRADAADMAQTPSGEIDMVQAQRLARDVEFWQGQQLALEELMKAASDALVRHGHDAYERQDLRNRGGISSNNATTMDEAKMQSILGGLGVQLPEREGKR